MVYTHSTHRLVYSLTSWATCESSDMVVQWCVQTEAMDEERLGYARYITIGLLIQTCCIRDANASIVSEVKNLWMRKRLPDVEDINITSTDLDVPYKECLTSKLNPVRLR